jgi:pimeloyl-ACP methyl ester carboxylesterase
MAVIQLRDGAAMSYADRGAGAPVLLVHGWAAHEGFFTDLSQRLAQGHRVITPTLRGHPGSAHGQLPLTIETIAEDIAELVERLDVSRIAALGWSMGAMVLWAAPAALRSRLSAVIVEDMGPRVVNDASWPHGLVGGYGAGDVASTLAEIDSDWPAYVARFAPRMFAPGVAPGLIAWAAAEMSRADGRAMASFWRSMAAQDCRAALARIAQPMLAIHGAESQVYPDEATAFIARSAPNARRIVIPGAGHVPHLEAPDEFFNHVEAFVRTTRQPELRSGGKVP